VTYLPDYTKKLEKILFKLKKKGPDAMNIINNKIPQILPEIGKNRAQAAFNLYRSRAIVFCRTISMKKNY
jgi:hypothetical protein